MKTGKETKPAGNIHRQQLFYWMRRSIDVQNGKRKLLCDELMHPVHIGYDTCKTCMLYTV